MDEAKSIVCTICGSYHLTKVSDIEYQCDHCGSIIRKEKAENLGKKLQELLEEGKNVDIQNLRKIVKRSLEGYIDRDTLVKCSNEILRIIPDDVLSIFYIKFAYRDIKPLDYENYLLTLINSATKTEINEIIDLIISNVKLREKDNVCELCNHFYENNYDEAIEKSLLQRTKEIELFSDIKRDVFICWQSKDKDKAIEVLNALENDGYTCWISLRNIPKDTDNYWSNITKAIKSCDIFLCISSFNTIQSKDCRKEIEIATGLDKKKRIEYKIDDSKEITLFKAFFTGQWITNINDLLLKVHELKNKELKLKKTAIEYLENKNYKNAKESFGELKNLSNDDEIDEYINIINIIESAIKLMNTNMYEEAKIKLLQINDIRYTKDLLDDCNINIRREDTESKPSSKNKEKDVLIKIKFLLDNSKDYVAAENLIFEKLAFNQNNFELWMLYLKAITKGFQTSNHRKTSIAFENLHRLCPDDEKDGLNKLDELLNPVTIQKRLDEEKRIQQEKKAEEEKRKQQEEARKLASEERRKREEEEKERKKGKKSVTLIVVMLIIQLVISIIVTKIKTNIILPSALDDDHLFVISLVFFVVYFFLSLWGWMNISPVYSVIEVVIYPISLMLIVYQWHIGFAIAYAVAHIILMIGGCIATYDGCTRKGTEIRDDGVFLGGMFKFGIPALLLAYELLMGLLGCN